MYAIYKVSGENTDSVYYGFCQGDDPRKVFLKSATHRTEDRGDALMVEENDGDIDSLVVEIVDSADSVEEAQKLRNELRVDPFAVTGPTYWPLGPQVFERSCPELKAVWDKSIALRNAATARQAYALGAYTKETIAALAIQHTRSVIVKALDVLTPKQFSTKYL